MSAPRFPLPVAETPPGFATAVDHGHMQALIGELILAGRPVRSCAPTYLRFKGVDGALVAWRVSTVDSDGRDVDLPVTARVASLDRLRSEAERFSAVERGIYATRPFALSEESQVLMLSLPCDRALRDLDVAFDLRKLYRGLEGYRPEMFGPRFRLRQHKSDFQIVTYKPERRLVGRWSIAQADLDLFYSTRHDLYVRIHADADLTAIAAGQAAAAASGVRCPSTLATLGDRIAIEPALRGKPIDPGRQGASRYYRELGCQLALLHRASIPKQVPRRSLDVELGELFSVCDDLTELDPTLGSGAREVVLQLQSARWSDDERCLVHGDLHPDQVVRKGERVAIVDFDRVACAPAASDLGNFAAHAHMRLGEDAASFVAAVEDGYRDQRELPPRSQILWYAAAGYLRGASAGFRQLQPDWPGQARHWIERAAATAAAGQSDRP